MLDRIGHYTIVSQLGRGGMGVVYKANEESLNRYVAIKLLGEHLSEDQAFLTRFVREAQAAAGLSHPNIVQIFFIGEDAGKHYFVMEYVSGKSLHSMIKEEGRIDNPRAAQLILQAAQGLAAAHDQGIIHRDIKPANLMLDPRGVVKIADFGLALPVESQTRLTATGMLMGTPGYLAPEQCRNEQVDHRTDIYALGVTFYELLTGGIPFKADSPLALLKQILDEEPPDIANLNPAVDDEARRILSKMIEKDRADRYQDCHELVSDLEEYIHSKGVRSATYGLATTTVPGDARPPRTLANDAPTQATPAVGSSSDASSAATAVTPAAGMSEAATIITPASASAQAPTLAVTSPGSTAPPPIPAGPMPHAAVASAQPKGSSRGLILFAILAFLMVGGAGAAYVAFKFVRGESLFGGDSASTVAVLDDKASGRTTSGSEPTETALAAMPDSDDGSSGTPGGDLPDDGMTPAGGGMVPLETKQGTSSITTAENAASGAGSQSANTPTQQTQPTQQKQTTTPPPAPRLSGTILAVSGDPNLTPYVSDIVMAELSSSGVQTEDASSLPGWDDLMRQDPQTGYLVDQVRKAGFASLILVRVDQTGRRQLNYMGRSDTAYATRVTIQKYDVASGRPVGQRATTSVEYTQLNAQREAEKNVGPVAREFVNGL